MIVIEIENNLNTLVLNFNKKSFTFDLVLAYGTSASTIKIEKASQAKNRHLKIYIGI